MKAKLPHPEHLSYIKHRNERMTQIILPVVISALLMVGMIALISVVTFRSGGDVGRWAAISTIWIIIPIMIAGLIFLTLLISLIYLLVLALVNLPHYTSLSQDYVYLAQIYIVRAADMVVKPIMDLDGYLESIKAFFGRINTL